MGFRNIVDNFIYVLTFMFLMTFQNCYDKPYFINKKLKIINLKRPG